MGTDINYYILLTFKSLFLFSEFGSSSALTLSKHINMLIVKRFKNDLYTVKTE